MTLAIQRPASTVTSVGVTLFGGAGTLHATLADNSDATYASMPSAAAIVTFAALSIPAGAVLPSVVLRMRCRRSTVCVLYAQLNDGPAITFHPPTGVTWTTLGSISQAHITSDQLSAGVRMVFSTTDFIDVAASYLDVTYVPVPTLNVTAPTGTIGVSRPTVTWDYTGDYLQERFQIKAFSSSQYGGAGFNVDTSTPLFDSGEQIGSRTSFVPTLNLPNGDTYRYYVKVAQKVGSVTQWSAWDSTTTTVSVTPAPVPTLAVVADNVQGRIQITATDTGTPTWQFVNIERTADGGQTWTRVRSADRAFVAGTSFVVYDYESGNGQPVQYRAQSLLADPAGDIASAWSATTAPTMWTSTTAWLKSMTRPTLNATVIINDIPTITRRIPRNVIDVAGRSDPIVVSDTRKWVEGSVTFVTLEDVDRDALQALLDTSETLLLQTPMTWGFGSRYISCGDEEEARTSPSALETSRLVTVPFNEVKAPVGQVLTFGSSWDDLAAGYADWTSVKAAFPTWNAVIAAHL